MKDKIPPFLKEQFKKKIPKIRFFPEEIKQFILEYNTYYHLEIPQDNLKLIYKLIKQGITKREKCGLEDCNKLQGFDVLDRMTIGCCKAHSQKITNLERYGVDNYYKTNEFQEKKKNTCLEKYGVEHQSQSEEIKEKKKQTCFVNFGVEHQMFDSKIAEKARINMLKTIPQAQKKREKTMLRRFGEITNLKCTETKEKIKRTNLERYGVENVLSKNSIIKQKVITEILERYGVIHHMQIPEVCEKQQNNRYKTKEYIWNTGEVSKVQGFEDIVLGELEEKGYKFQEVLTSKKDMPEIWYEFEGQQRRYFPDFYIPHENLVIEVKSSYTIKKDNERNKLKWEATRNLGYNFIVEIR